MRTTQYNATSLLLESARKRKREQDEEQKQEIQVQNKNDSAIQEEVSDESDDAFENNDLDVDFEESEEMSNEPMV